MAPALAVGTGAWLWSLSHQPDLRCSCLTDWVAWRQEEQQKPPPKALLRARWALWVAATAAAAMLLTLPLLGGAC